MNSYGRFNFPSCTYLTPHHVASWAPFFAFSRTRLSRTYMPSSALTSIWHYQVAWCRGTHPIVQDRLDWATPVYFEMPISSPVGARTSEGGGWVAELETTASGPPSEIRTWFIFRHAPFSSSITSHLLRIL